MSTIRQLRRLLPYARPYGRGWAVIALATILSTLAGLLQPWPMKVVVDHVLGGRPADGTLGAVLSTLPGPATPIGILAWMVAAGFLAVAAVTILEVLISFAWVHVGYRMTYALSERLFSQLQRRSLLFHVRHPVGDSLSRVTTDSWCVYTLASAVLINPARAVLMLALAGWVLFSLQPTLTLIALSVAPLMAWSTHRFGRPIRQIAVLQREVEAELESHVQRTLRSIPLVVAFGQEERERMRFDRFADEAIRIHRKGAVAAGMYDFGGGFIPILGTAGVLWAGGTFVLQGSLTVGGLLVFVAYLTNLQTHLRSLIDVWSTLQRTGASVSRVMEVLEAEEEVRDVAGARPIERARGRIELEGVSFGYEPGHAVLRDVTLRVEPGQTVALVGATGAGKSTLVSLVPRFFDPWEGRVRVDGVDVRELTLESLRAQVSLVLQEPFLFPITVAENIAYGRPGATLEEIEAAAIAANADDFIRRLPEGYETRIGERGATLSGGERQRLAIARALLRDAPILILDEPTSALDAETEALVMEALGRLMRGRTTLIIAHRFSTIQRADRIAVLEHGRVAEFGTADELLANEGTFRRLQALQLLDNVEPLVAGTAR
jgi:ATP-binding cassette, subfamily B, bacterial